MCGFLPAHGIGKGMMSISRLSIVGMRVQMIVEDAILSPDDLSAVSRPVAKPANARRMTTANLHPRSTLGTVVCCLKLRLCKRRNSRGRCQSQAPVPSSLRP